MQPLDTAFGEFIGVGADF